MANKKKIQVFHVRVFVVLEVEVEANSSSSNVAARAEGKAERALKQVPHVKSAVAHEALWEGEHRAKD